MVLYRVGLKTTSTTFCRPYEGHCQLTYLHTLINYTGRILFSDQGWLLCNMSYILILKTGTEMRNRFNIYHIRLMLDVCSKLR
jgi:hypothetical protein